MTEDDRTTQGLDPAEAERLRQRGTRPRVPSNYRLIQRIGRGGMGEVWHAEQVEPIKRSVALKVIKRGLDTSQVIARFQSERQALARMDHPYIAKIFEAGETENGRPFFVMERVQGEPITVHCDRQRLSTSERLELFRKVCEGVQHAHQKAVIHRDLKPSNVLVTIDGDQHVPKIIDFGIAKATTVSLTDSPHHTQLGQLLGTPEYMSPEQAEAGNQDIDTRSDVYSLGVLLYVLLVGALPFDPTALRQRGISAIHRVIREEEPPRPSTRLSSLGEESTAFAAARRSDVGRLSSELRGDLDWITMKTLEKDRTRRYASASELAADISRYLKDEPVEASPPSLIYAARKFLRRHRTGAVAATLVVLSLVLGALGATWGWVSATRSEARALQEAQTAKRVSEFLVEIFERSDPDRSRGEELTARQVLDEGVLAIRQELGDEPRVKATLLETMGRVYTALGLYDDARPLLEENLSLRSGEAFEGPSARGRAESRLAQTVMWQGDHEQAIVRSQTAAELLEVGGEEDAAELASALNVLGNALQNSGNLDEARTAHERSLAIREALDPPQPEAVAASVHNLAINYHFRNDFDRAAELYQRAAEIERQTRGENTASYATSLHTLAIVRKEQSRFDEAYEIERQALEIRERVLGPDHPHVAFSLTTLGQLEAERDHHALSEQLFRRAVKIGLASWDSLYPENRWMRRNLASSLERQQRWAEAEQVLVELRDETAAAAATNPDLKGALTPTLNALGELHRSAGDSAPSGAERKAHLARAEASYARSVEIESAVSGPDHPYVLEGLVPAIEVCELLGKDPADLCARALGIAASEPGRTEIEGSLLERLEVSCVG